tara:strand:- start:10072 stop:10338 length:267 start_codon:yes stop_codon:yes gene_type:complete
MKNSVNKLLVVRKTYEQTGGNNVGPTADNSSRIALLKKVQVRTKQNGKKQISQLWGLNDLAEKGNKSGSGGDSGTRTYFVGIFPRMAF